MTDKDATIGIFADHQAAENAINKLVAHGFDMKDLSIVGKGFHTEEKVVGFYNIGDRMAFWGNRGAFWGGLWGLFLGGVVLTLPVVGQVVILGTLAATLVAGVEGAILGGGVSALGAALYSIGVPRDTILEYEAALKSDGFLVMVHGSVAEMKRAKEVLATLSAVQVETHEKAKVRSAA